MSGLSVGRSVGVAIELGLLLELGCGRSDVFVGEAEIVQAQSSSTGNAISSTAGSSTGRRGSSGTSAGVTSSGTGTAGGSSSAGASSSGVSSSTGGTTGGSSSGTGATGSTSGGQTFCGQVVEGDGGAYCSGFCPTPYECATDPIFGDVCTSTCVQSSDCLALDSVCVNGICETNACGLGTGNGVFNSLCNASGMGDGTCIPYFEVTIFDIIGLCTEGGTSTTCCNLLANRCDPQDACVAGMVCDKGVCYPACEPGVIGCVGGEDCNYTSTYPPAGICALANKPQCP